MERSWALLEMRKSFNTGLEDLQLNVTNRYRESRPKRSALEGSRRKSDLAELTQAQSVDVWGPWRKASFLGVKKDRGGWVLTQRELRWSLESKSSSRWPSQLQTLPGSWRRVSPMHCWCTSQGRAGRQALLHTAQTGPGIWCQSLNEFPEDKNASLLKTLLCALLWCMFRFLWNFLKFCFYRSCFGCGFVLFFLENLSKIPNCAEPSGGALPSGWHSLAVTWGGSPCPSRSQGGQCDIDGSLLPSTPGAHRPPGSHTHCPSLLFDITAFLWQIKVDFHEDFSPAFLLLSNFCPFSWIVHSSLSAWWAQYVLRGVQINRLMSCLRVVGISSVF